MPKVKAGESIKLEHGMKLKFVAAETLCATYKIKIVSNSLIQDSQLILLRVDNNPSYPEKITINTNEFLLGRSPDNVFAKLGIISRQHAVIKRMNGEFIYEHKGQNAALIIPAAKNRLTTLLHTVQINLNLLEFTSNLEKDSGEIPAYEIAIGGKTENALISFILFLKSYRYLNFSQLQKSNELVIFEKLITVLKQLKKQRIELRKIQTNDTYKYDLLKYNVSETNTYSYHECLRGFVKQLYEKLLASENKEIFLLGGTGDHHAIHKLYINQQTGRSHLITYNAGLDAVEVENTDNVMGIHETLLKNGTDIENFLFTLYEKKLRGSLSGTSPIYKILREELNSHLESDIVRYRICPKQHRGNCTTRSIREMLRDNLSESTFNQLANFIRMPRQILAELQSLHRSPDKQIINITEDNPKKCRLLSISDEIFFASNKSCKYRTEDTPSGERAHQVTASSLGF